MKMSRVFCVSAACAAVLLSFVAVADTITLESLLGEMTDARVQTLAGQNWRGRLFSSYNRTGTNIDYSNYLETRTVNNIQEHILLDATGPGAVVRFWCANVANGAKLRFYIDGDDAQHCLEVNLVDILGGTAWAGAPLSAFVSPTCAQSASGRNLYLPIPYSSSLKIALVGQGANYFWYNIEVREYAAGTAVESFSSAVLTRAADAIAAANTTLSAQFIPTATSSQAFDGEIAAGGVKTLDFTGPAALSDLQLSVSGTDAPLDKVRVLLAFDGETTLDVSLGQFFGCGMKAANFTMRHLSYADGLMRATRVMPFKTSATLTITNGSSAAVTLANTAAALSAYEWDDAKSMHFGGYGFYEENVPAFANGYDKRWVKLRGEGVLFGNQLSIDNTAANYNINIGWWGEGDEKIKVDGKKTYLGTGTEDFFGYAYGPSKAFSTEHPFLALPVADNVATDSKRIAVMSRERALDVVPFTNQLELTVEIWHWQETTLKYAPATFWYLRPGGTYVRPDDPAWNDVSEAVKVDDNSDKLTIVAEEKQGDLVTSVTLALDHRYEQGGVYVAYGAEPGGSTTDTWQRVELVRALDASIAEVKAAMPAGWGDTIHAVRFFLIADRALTSADYFGGDYAQFDAIDNAGRGQHCVVSNVWVNLADPTRNVTYQSGSANFLAAAFQGGTSYFVMNGDASTWWQGMGDTYTWEAFVTPASGWASSSANASIMGNCTVNGAVAGVYFGQSQSTLNYVVCGVAANGGAVGELRLYPQDIPDGEMMHLAYVSEPDGVKLYVNGELYASENCAMPALNDPKPFWLGACYEIKRKFTGLIHAARLSTSALTADALAVNANFDRYRFSGDEIYLHETVSTAVFFDRAQPAKLAGVELKSVTKTSATFAVSVLSLGDGENPAIYAVWGNATNLVGSTAVEGENEVAVEGLERGVEYTYSFFVRTTSGDSDLSAAVVFDLEEAFIEGSDIRTLTITGREVNEEGYVTAVDLALGKASEHYHGGKVYLVLGAENGAEASTNDWDEVLMVAEAPSSLTTLQVDFPAGWYETYAFARLVLIGEVDCTTDDYADNAYAFFDAIENGGKGIHVASSNVWVNLADSTRNGTCSSGSASFGPKAFQGGSNYFVMDRDPGSWWTPLGNTCTFEALVTPPSSGWERQAKFIMGGYTGTGTNTGVYFGQGNGKSGIEFGVAKATIAYGNVWLALSDITRNVPMLLTYVIRPTGTELFVNGQSYTSQAATMPALNDASRPFWLGAMNGAAWTFPGQIHSARIYARSLDAEEIAQNWKVDGSRYVSGDFKRVTSVSSLIPASSSQMFVILKSVEPIAARSATINYEIVNCPAGAGSLFAVFGGNTERLAKNLADGVGSAVLHGLETNTAYRLKLQLRASGFSTVESEEFEFTTLAEEEENYGESSRTIVLSGPEVSKKAVTLAITEGGAGRLYVAYGSENGGDETNSWAQVDFLADIGEAATNVVYAFPKSWGKSVFALRFFLISEHSVKLPDGYTLLKGVYMSTINSTQGLDLGFAPDSHRIHLVFSTPPKNTGYTPIMVADFKKFRWLEINGDPLATQDERYDYLNSAGQERFTSTGGTNGDGVDIYVTHDTEVTLDYGVGADYLAMVTINGNTTQVGNAVQRQGNGNLWFGRDYNGNNQVFAGTIYEVKVWDAKGAPFADMYPARASNNALGLYDLVRNQFYAPSADTTSAVEGDFGPDVSSSPSLNWSAAYKPHGMMIIIR